MEASVAHLPQGSPAFFGGRLLALRSDDQLVALFRLGEDDAFAAIHERYRRRLLGYCRRMVAGSGLDAEDVLQDVMVRAYAALRGDDRPVTLRAWLFRVAHNRCIDLLRRPVPSPAEVLDVSRGPELGDPALRAERREHLRRLVTDVTRLPGQQRSALLLRELEGLSHAELSDALGVSIPAVKSLLVRARTGLVAAGEARDAACADIRAELVDAGDRGVRCSGRARRHVHDCRPCRRFQAALGRDASRVGLFLPGPLGALAAALGLGGPGGAAGAAAGGIAAAKVAAVVSTVAVVGSGAAQVHERVTAPPVPAPRVQAAPPVAVAAAAPRAVARTAQPASPRAGAAAAARRPAGAGDRAVAATPGASVIGATDAVVDGSSGGASAPDETAFGPPSSTTGGGHGAADEPSPADEATAVVREALAPVLPTAQDAPSGGNGGTAAGSAR